LTLLADLNLQIFFLQKIYKNKSGERREQFPRIAKVLELPKNGKITKEGIIKNKERLEVNVYGNKV
jgi:hypothetical protein